ncbi:ribonuclease H-like domain-containing protein [Aspergillus californicus]
MNPYTALRRTWAVPRVINTMSSFTISSSKSRGYQYFSLCRAYSSFNMSPSPEIIDTAAAIADLVDLCKDVPNDPPSLYVDIEGINLSRYGSISIMQIYHVPRNQIYLVDVHTLGQTAFSTPSPTGTTLKSILESPTIQKAFFDVRNDSDALYSHFGVHLGGIHDIQLLELATRSFPRRFVTGLSRCIEYNAELSTADSIQWKAIKDRGRKLFAPELGGSYSVFNTRPMAEELAQYCAQDVCILPQLWRLYHDKLEPAWAEKMQAAVRERIDVCLDSAYTGKGRDMALVPKGWA